MNAVINKEIMNDDRSSIQTCNSSIVTFMDK